MSVKRDGSQLGRCRFVGVPGGSMVLLRRPCGPPRTATVILPPAAAPRLAAFAAEFTRPTALRFQTLLAATLLTTGRRTISGVLRTLRHLAPGHPTAYRRVFSRADWSGLRLGCALARVIVARLPGAEPIRLVGDDTVDGHTGRTVYAKARHRDPVRSTRSYTAWRYGHKWVVLAVLVRFPFATRPWARPVLVDLYRDAAGDAARRRPHRTPAQVRCRLLRLLMIRLPGRTFVFAGDSGFGTHEVARFCHRHRSRLTLVSKLHPEANLFDPPGPYKGVGRRPVKGGRRVKPSQAAGPGARRTVLTVGWYGGGRRRVGVVGEAAHWFKAGHGLVPIRWVSVRDKTGTHRDEFLFTTDPSLEPAEIIGHDCGRWNIETTFQEVRAHLGLETTRGRCAKTVTRAAPCLFGLYAVVAVLYDATAPGGRVGRVEWPGKATATFSDALTCVRRRMWSGGVFPRAGCPSGLEKLPEPLRELLLTTLAPAA